jgi:hypothetical protein
MSENAAGTNATAELNRLRKRVADLSALLVAVREIAAPTGLDAFAPLLTRCARLLLGVDVACISLRDSPDELPTVRACQGQITAFDGDLGVLLRTEDLGGIPLPFWTENYLAEDRLPKDPAVADAVRAEGIRALLAVPIGFGSQLFGVVCVGQRSVRRFDPEEVSLLATLAENAAVAIENRLTIEHERAEIKRRDDALAAVQATLDTAQELAELQERLTELILTGADLNMLAIVARGRFGGALRIRHVNGADLTVVGNLGPDEPAAELAAMRAHASEQAVPLAPGFVVAAIKAGNQRLGTVVLRTDHTIRACELDMIALFTRAFALVLAAPGRATDIPCENRDELLGDLLSMPQLAPRQIDQRAGRLGVNLRAPHVVVVVRPEGETLNEASVWASRHSNRNGGLMTVTNGRVVLLLPGTNPGGTAKAVWQELDPLLKMPTTVSGAGPVADGSAVYHGYQEAERCLDAMTALGATGRHASVNELGFFGLLLSDRQDIEGFINSTIGAVLAYDTERATDLSRTLEAYFESNASPTYAAKLLHVHVNTVARRLERITELLGEWQPLPERALQIQLALRLSRIRDQLREVPAISEPPAAAGGAG